MIRHDSHFVYNIDLKYRLCNYFEIASNDYREYIHANNICQEFYPVYRRQGTDNAFFIQTLNRIEIDPEK